MLNSEKYTTSKERAEAFNNFCNKNVCHWCFDDYMHRGLPCMLKWLEHEAGKKEAEDAE